MKMGRPDMYSPKLGEEICEAIANSCVGIQTLIKQNPHWPCEKTIYDWLIRFPDFLQMYKLARSRQADFLAFQTLEIADDSSNDTMTAFNSKGQAIEIENREWTNRSRLRIMARQWLAARLAPNKYGDNKVSEQDNKLTIVVKKDQISINNDQKKLGDGSNNL
jgi:hypothetical protein